MLKVPSERSCIVLRALPTPIGKLGSIPSDISYIEIYVCIKVIEGISGQEPLEFIKQFAMKLSKAICIVVKV